MAQIKFNIYLDDLSDAARSRLSRVFGDLKDTNWDAFCLATATFNNDDPDSSLFPGDDIELDSFLGDTIPEDDIELHRFLGDTI